MRKQMERRNVTVDGQATRLTMDGKLTMSFSGVYVSSNRKKRVAKEVVGHEVKNLKADNLSISVDLAECGKGAISMFLNTAKQIREGSLNLGSSDCPLKENSDISATVSGKGVAIDSLTYEADWIERNGAFYANRSDAEIDKSSMSIDSFEMSGSLEAVLEGIMQLSAMSQPEEEETAEEANRRKTEELLSKELGRLNREEHEFLVDAVKRCKERG